MSSRCIGLGHGRASAKLDFEILYWTAFTIVRYIFPLTTIPAGFTITAKCSSSKTTSSFISKGSGAFSSFCKREISCPTSIHSLPLAFLPFTSIKPFLKDFFIIDFVIMKSLKISKA